MSAPSKPSVLPDPVVKTAIIRASRREVWNAFTTAAGATTFFARSARIELRRGGPYEIHFDLDAPAGQRGSEGCRVLSYVENEMLSFTWNAPPQFPGERWQRTFVVVQLHERGAHETEVQLVHDGWKDGGQWREVRAYFERAWDVVLGRLKERFARGPLWTPVALAAGTASDTRHYVYFIRPTREGFFEKATDDEAAVIREHAAYVRRLLGEGRLVLAGPAFDPPQYPSQGLPLEAPAPGIVIFEAGDDAEALRAMEEDPAVRAGVFRARVNPFSLAYLNDLGR